MNQQRLTALQVDVFSGWITTILTYPISSHNIDTVDELITTKLPVYSPVHWKSFLTDRLNNQYVFYSNYTGFSYGPMSVIVGTDDFYQEFLRYNQSFLWHKVSYSQIHLISHSRHKSYYYYQLSSKNKISGEGTSRHRIHGILRGT